MRKSLEHLRLSIEIEAPAAEAPLPPPSTRSAAAVRDGMLSWSPAKQTTAFARGLHGGGAGSRLSSCSIRDAASKANEERQRQMWWASPRDASAASGGTSMFSPDWSPESPLVGETPGVIRPMTSPGFFRRMDSGPLNPYEDAYLSPTPSGRRSVRDLMSETPRAPQPSPAGGTEAALRSQEWAHAGIVTRTMGRRAIANTPKLSGIRDAAMAFRKSQQKPELPSKDLGPVTNWWDPPAPSRRPSTISKVGRWR